MKATKAEEKCLTGVPGLDDVLGGGLPAGQLFLLRGKPGTGKTTLAMQFLMEGVRCGERVLYITFSETQRELEAVARSHGWDVSKVAILELSAVSASIATATQNTLFHSSEVALSKVIALLLDKVKQVNADRIVMDSVSELQLMADSSFRYRRQMLAFKEFFVGRGSTVLFLDDMTSDGEDLHVQSIVHGVMLLEKFRAGYGVERREFHISKLRSVEFRGGTHDYVIRRGGLEIFPRRVAHNHDRRVYPRERISSGVAALDDLLGGGLDRGSSNLILGPAGSGKSTLSLRFAVSAAERGKRVAIYSFEENIENIRQRAADLGMSLVSHLESGRLTLRKVNPAELTPGQFNSIVRDVGNEQADMIIIDSLNGYVHAMPEQQFLILQLHELLSYLSGRGVVTILILSQAGIMGSMQAPLDLTYLADSVILTRFFEAFGHIKKAISVLKKRSGAHEETLREFQVGPGGVIVGKVLKEFSGIFTGVPKFSGTEGQIMQDNRG